MTTTNTHPFRGATNRSPRHLLLTASLLVGALCAWTPAQAGPIYDWVCDNPGCNGDAGFTFSIEFSDAAVAAGSFIGVNGNVLSASITSSVGDGYAQTLDDLIEGGGVLNDRTNFGVTFSPDRSYVVGLFDSDVIGEHLDFSNAGGITSITGGLANDYFVSWRVDRLPIVVDTFSDIHGTLVRRTVPEPATLSLLGLVLASGSWRLRRSRSART